MKRKASKVRKDRDGKEEQEEWGKGCETPLLPWSEESRRVGFLIITGNSRGDNCRSWYLF